MVTQFEIDRFILKGKGASVTLSMDRWREDCSGYTEVSGVTVRQWQMVQRAHGSGREAPERSEPALCTIVLLRLGLNLKLIKDMQQHSLLTWLFTFPSPFFFFFQPLHPSICPSMVSQLENTNRWKGTCRLMPGGQYWRDYRKARWREQKSQSNVMMQQWPFPGLLLDVHVHFSRSLTLLAVDHTKKSSDVSSPTFPHYS